MLYNTKKYIIIMVLSLKTYIISKQLLLKRLIKIYKKNKVINHKFIISIMDLDNSFRLLYGFPIKSLYDIQQDLIRYLEEYVKI